MKYSIAYKKSVARDLKKIGKKNAETLLRKIERELPEKADRCSQLTGKFAMLRKYRIGDYQVIFTLIKDTVMVLRISHRRDVYK